MTIDHSKTKKKDLREFRFAFATRVCNGFTSKYLNCKKSRKSTITRDKKYRKKNISQENIFLNSIEETP